MAEQTQELTYRPDRIGRGEFPNYKICNMFYLVTQGDDPLFAYNSTYYPSAREVVADMIARRDPNETTLEGTKWGSMDFAVWRDHRLMAVVHQDFNCEVGSCQTLFFSEERNDLGSDGESFYGWPSREEWVVMGRPDRFELTDEDMERNRAREDEGKNIQLISLEEIRTDLLSKDDQEIEKPDGFDPIKPYDPDEDEDD